MYKEQKGLTTTKLKETNGTKSYCIWKFPPEDESLQCASNCPSMSKSGEICVTMAVLAGDLLWLMDSQPIVLQITLRPAEGSHLPWTFSVGVSDAILSI